MKSPESHAQATDGSFLWHHVARGSTNQGTVFKITSAGVLTTLHSFSGVDGDNPQAGLIQAANKLIRVPKSRPLYPPGR